MLYTNTTITHNLNMISTIYNLSQNFYNLSCFHARRQNTLRMKGYYHISNALLEAKTFLQSL